MLSYAGGGNILAGDQQVLGNHYSHMHYVTDASYAGGYKLRLRFDDDAVRVVDLTEHLDGPVFQPLKDPSFFKRFTLNQDIDTVVWPNGADFSPDFLYKIGKSIGEQATGADALTRVAQS